MLLHLARMLKFYPSPYVQQVIAYVSFMVAVLQVVTFSAV